ncbi:MAG: transcription-repair coupling factor [Chlamydiales bacterium]|nr:transcription-repair coupling factor [Chlamydiia bacterium]MCP5507818.1 transcription-repair coupling factor [Chlamydiales bacterium]
MDETVRKTLAQSAKLQALEHALRDGDTLLIEELWNAPKALVAALAQRATGKHILMLTGANATEMRLFHDFIYFSDRPIVDYPAWETLPSENIAPSPDIVGERYKVLKAVSGNGDPHIIISNLHACLQKVIVPQQFDQLYVEVNVGDAFGYQTLIDKLAVMGYTRRPVAADKGEFAVRGGIIDIFPVSTPEPYRIEFWGDDVESIRTYDPIGQKSVHSSNVVRITPAKEMEFLENSKEMGTLLDYLGKETIVIFDDLLALEDRYASLVNISGKASGSLCSLEEFLNLLEPMQKIYLTPTPIEELCDIQVLEKTDGSFYSDSIPIHKIRFEMFNRKLEAKRWVHPFIGVRNFLFPDREADAVIGGDDVLLALGRLADSDIRLHLLYGSGSEETTVQKRLLDAQISLPPTTTSEIGYLSSGFFLSDDKMMVLPMTEITHRYKIRRQKLRSTFHTTPSEFYDLTPGEMVVHLNHGIGKFLGYERRPDHNNVISEFLLIEYAKGSKLFVPVSQSHLVSKYIGSNDEIPKMHEIGSKRWARTRVITEKAIIGYAKDLLELYARREVGGGYAFPSDSEDVSAFEEEFPFIETEDQLAAVDSVKQDMQSAKAMDRLICGDVGYGKTEVAMRAAIKAVIDGGKQVTMLVPTTVLAMQHYENFLERMANFPINVAVLSRFRTAKQIKDTLEKVEQGTIDILIGTHRIVSGDITFKNLGLVIIDEEQRFGVRTKEHLKRIKMGVDCLTLSATPIPRTLYMSLVGARDMSVISTPPHDRMPIKTIIEEPRDALIKNALLRELARDGQAFFIHNRVETLPDVVLRLKKLLPKARIAMVHGQMHSDEIDNTFHAFKSGKIDILCATTIIESGIDIPNANTILIDRADTFGLADLYQMRGRVGRWNKLAYAYFLVPRLRALPEISRKRLNALAEASGYGGGMKLAMRDLEIRGAGDILGTEQSGHVSAIGFHFYCKLLKRTIRALQGKGPMLFADTKVELAVDARLPDDYVNESSLRMEIYQRLGEAMAWKEVDAIYEELRDRFGIPPAPAKWLYHITRIRIYAAERGYTLVKQDKLTLTTEKGKGNITKTILKMPNDPEEAEKVLLKQLR